MSNNGQGEVDVATALAAAGLVSGDRRWPGLILGLVLGGAVTWVATSYFGDRGDQQAVDQEVVQLSTAEVEQRDLLEEIEWAGTLGYGELVTINGTAGTVTSSTTTGETLERGDVLATVDNQSVVVLYGDTPMWRDLSEGTEGNDVLQLEANLAALGYDPDQTVDIDNTFTANTAAMVERWEEDLGREPTGVVRQGSVAIVEGPSAVVTVAEEGSSATGELAVLAPRQAFIDVVVNVDGTVTSLPPIGSRIEHGSTLFEVDDVPIVALTELDSVSMELTSDTFTIVELEGALAEAGYDPDGELAIDGVATDATSAALERWQSAAGLPVTGESDPGYYQLVPTGQAIEAHLVSEGDSSVAGGPVLVASASRLSVDLTVDVADADEFELGQQVTIELADDQTSAGVVVEISSVNAALDPEGSPTVEITIDVVAEADQVLIEGPVTVISIGDAVDGATVVPTRALVSLAEGGFAVEKLNPDGSSTLIGIELGTFDDGLVEVTEGDVAPGDDVVVPR